LVDPPVGPAVDPAIARAPSGIPTVDFAREIAPILESKCLPCHGPEKQRSGYRVDVRSVALEGGEYSAPNIVPGNAAKSPLYLYVSGGDPEMEMPPKGEPLNPAEIDLIKRGLIPAGYLSGLKARLLLSLVMRDRKGAGKVAEAFAPYQ
jgi:hypothetical protein